MSTISKDSSSLTPQDDATKQEVTVTTAITADGTNDASNGTSNATTNNKETNKELTVKTQISSANNEYTFDQVFKSKDGTQSPDDDSSLSSEESTILSPSASHSTATPLKSFQTIFTLPNCELMERLESTTLTKESILQAHNIIAQYNLSDETWYHNVNDSKEDSQTAIAIYLLQNSNLKNLRFKLVPSKLKEDAFWYSIFFLCMTSQEQYQLVHTSDTCSEKSSKELYKLVKCQSQDIVKLQQKIEDLKMELKDALEHQPRVVTQPIVENVPEKERKTHIGTWIMEKESIEFLQLDEEIKKKLRDGKQKRLQDVHEQMKFILDSDDVKDSRGKWDGCGCDSYGGECGAEC